MVSRKHETLYERLSEQPRRTPVDKQAAMMLHSAQPEFVSELDPNNTHVESSTFIKSYTYSDWMSYHHPNMRKSLAKQTDHSGSTFGKLKVQGVYLPDHDEDVPNARRHKTYTPQGKMTCPCCGQTLKYANPRRPEKTLPKLKWVCRCVCGNYKVITSVEANRADRKKLSMSCSACEQITLLKEKVKK